MRWVLEAMLLWTITGQLGWLTASLVFPGRIAKVHADHGVTGTGPAFGGVLLGTWLLGPLWWLALAIDIINGARDQ